MRSRCHESDEFAGAQTIAHLRPIWQSWQGGGGAGCSEAAGRVALPWKLFSIGKGALNFHLRPFAMQAAVPGRILNGRFGPLCACVLSKRPLLRNSLVEAPLIDPPSGRPAEIIEFNAGASTRSLARSSCVSRCCAAAHCALPNRAPTKRVYERARSLLHQRQRCCCCALMDCSCALAQITPISMVRQARGGWRPSNTPVGQRSCSCARIRVLSPARAANTKVAPDARTTHLLH